MCVCDFFFTISHCFVFALIEYSYALVRPDFNLQLFPYNIS